MNETEKTTEIEIDLARLFKALWKHAVVLLLAAVLGGAIFFTGAKFFITPLYKATAVVYVNNSSSSSSGSVTTADLNASQSLVDSYIVILKTRLTLEEVIEAAELSYTYEELCDMISAASINDTEFFNIDVTSTDPVEAALIANTIAALLPGRITSLINGTSAYIADYAVTPDTADSPNVVKYTALGLILGLLIAAGIVIVRELLDDQIRQDGDLLQMYPDIPILASIPDLRSQPSGGYGYGYDKKPKNRKKAG